ncbi:MAG: SurA N-terminal domain-containing protein [Candidatus Binatia bacterium]
MRRNARSWFIKVALAVISLVFIFFMGGGTRIGSGPSAVAVVDGDEISLADFQRAQLNNRAYYQDLYGDNLTPELLKALDIPSASLSRLVDTRLLVQEARRLGLMIPDETVRRAIRNIDAFERDGEFSPSIYKTVLQRQSLTPAAFEASMREELLVNQLRDIVSQGVHVSEEEAWEAYRTENSKITLSYIELKGSDFENAVELSEDDVRNFFEKNDERYRRPASAGIRYLAYSPDIFSSRTGVSQEEIEEYYELNRTSEFTQQEAVGARHILKRVPQDASDEKKTEIRKEIEAIAKRIADGEDFAELAKKHSDDATGTAGGDLGIFGRLKMVKPFEEAAFALEEGEVSDIVETRFGFHIIKVYERQPAGTRKLEEVREEIRKLLARRKAGDIAFDAAAACSAAVVDGATMEEVAAEDGLEIQTTPLLSRGDLIPGIGRAPDLVDAALALRKDKANISDPIKVGDTYYVVSLADQKQSYIPELADVREQVEEALRRKRGAEAALERADALLVDLQAGKKLDEVAAQASLEVKYTDPFNPSGNFVPGLGNVSGLKELAFQATEDGEALGRSFPHRGNAYVFVRKSFEEPDREDFDEVRDDRIEALRAQRELQAYTQFVKALKSNTEITYNPDLVQSVMP